MTITAELVGFILGLMAAAWAVWWKVSGLVESAKSAAINAALLAQTKADILQTALHDHKLHVAETYVSKSGMREQTEQIMSAIKDVGSHVNTINERLDRFVEGQATRRPTKALD